MKNKDCKTSSFKNPLLFVFFSFICFFKLKKSNYRSTGISKNVQGIVLYSSFISFNGAIFKTWTQKIRFNISNYLPEQGQISCHFSSFAPSAN